MYRTTTSTSAHRTNQVLGPSLRGHNRKGGSYPAVVPPRSSHGRKRPIAIGAIHPERPEQALPYQSFAWTLFVFREEKPLSSLRKLY